MADTLDARLAAFATSLRDVRAIHSDAVEKAFASVYRHRCVPSFLYGPTTVTVSQDELPESEILDIVYSHQSLLISTGQTEGFPRRPRLPR